MTQNDNMFADGIAYETLMGRWSRLVAHTFLPWINVAPDQDWLDVGCGNGAVTEEIIAHCSPRSITGLDASEEQIAYARSRVEGKTATYLKGDAQSLPFDDKHFDATVMALVTAFLPDPARAVGEMARVTKAGGTVATYMWDLPAGGSPLEPAFAAMRSMDIPPSRFPSLEASTAQGLTKLWKAAGLADVTSKVISIPVRFQNFDEFWTSIAVPVGPQGKVIEALPPQKREALKALVRERVPFKADGTIEYEAFSNTIVGRVV